MIEEYATIAIPAQAPVCDIRLCDNRSSGVQERMDRGEIIAWMQSKRLNNRQLAEILGIEEDKVSKSLKDPTKGKPRQWQGSEVAKLIDLMRDSGNQIVRADVKGTGMSASEIKDAWAMPGDVKPVPLLGTAFGGDWEGLESVETTELRLHEVIDLLNRPASLADDNDAYAVEIVGESMAPRYEPGERAYVSPKAPVRPGDDVIVQLANAGGTESQVADTVTEVLIKRLVRRTATHVELLQFNPRHTFKVPIERIARVDMKLAIHRVRGRL